MTELSGFLSNMTSVTTDTVLRNNQESLVSPGNGSTEDDYFSNDLMKMYEEQIVKEFYDGLLTYNAPFTIVLMTLYFITFLLGSIGNAMVIFVVLRNRKMRTVTNTFLVNLAVGDIQVVLICMPFTVAPYVYKNWIYGDVLCKLTPFLQGISIGVSVLTLLAISIDRFLAIHFPLKARIIFSKAKVKMMVVCIWIISIAIATPMAIINNLENEPIFADYSIQMCQESWPSLGAKNIYNISIFLFFYLLPLASMVAAYSKIARTLWNGDGSLHQTSRGGSMRDQAAKLIRGRRRVVKMLMLLVVMFALLWLPYHVVNIYLDFNRGSKGAGSLALVVYPLVQWLGLANSSTNPLCYCFFSKTFRDSFMEVCMCCRCLRHRTDSMSYNDTHSNDDMYLHSSGKRLSRRTTKRSSVKTMAVNLNNGNKVHLQVIDCSYRTCRTDTSESSGPESHFSCKSPHLRHSRQPLLNETPI